jgi:predicted O-methyltransferase YrrM
MLGALGLTTMTHKSEIKALIEDIEGFLTNKDGSLLYGLTKKVKGKGMIVEIGSWKGKSTIWLAKGSKKGNQVSVFAVDHHGGSPEHRRATDKVWTFDEFKGNIKKAGVSDVVRPIVKTSVEASRNFDEPIELLFIDGAHDYDSVKSDYNSWFPKLVDGGIIAFHDSEFHGVSEFLEELVNTQENVKFVGFGGSIACIRKVGRITRIDAFRNRQLVNVIKFRGNIAWARKRASSISKPLYNLVRNLARLYRFILVKIC